MSNKKQSSIDWLLKAIDDKINMKSDKTYGYIINKAKEMHKEEIIESYCQGCLDMTNDDTIFPRETSEQYYIDKFDK